MKRMIFLINLLIIVFVFKAWSNDLNLNYEQPNYSSVTFQNWKNGQWVNVQKTEYEYDSNQRPVMIILYNYSQDTWNKYYRLDMVWNTKDLLLSSHGFMWNENSWSDYSKTINTYSDKNLLTITETYQWIYNWVPSSKLTYFYEDTLLKTVIRQDIIKDSFKPVSMESYSYNSKNQKSQYLIQSWKDTSWLNKERYFYEYNTNGNLVFTNYQKWAEKKWDGAFNTWDTVYNSHNRYDNLFNLVQTYREDYLYGVWTPSNIDTSTYNDKRLIKNTVMKWDFNHWDSSTARENLYDNLNRLIMTVNSTYKDSSFINSTRIIYSYEPLAVDETINNSALILYPNPVHDYIILDSKPGNMFQPSKIEIISALGIKLLETDYKNKIDVSCLSPGIYFVKVGGRVEKFLKLN